ncbi:MAG: PilT/PilU family type 4a pilus ATPase [Pyrinomonadaceae bacterium]
MSASGNSDIDLEPLQGSQISMMVFPLIPADVKQELPNQPSVQFVYPSNIGEFDFTVQKTSAGFNVTIKPTPGGSIPAAPAEPVSQPETGSELPSIDMSTASFPPIDLQPIDAPPAGQAASGEPTAETREKPQLERSNGAISFDDFASRSTGDTSAPISFEHLEAAKEFVPVADPETVVPANEVIRNSVRDRRAGERTGSNSAMQDRMEGLFHAMAEAGASDLHLSVGMPPMVRKDGRITKLETPEEQLNEDLMKDLLHSIMPERNKAEFSERHDTDFAYEIAGLARFRSNIFMDRKGMGAVFRIIPSKMTTAEQLGLSKAIMGLTELSKGLVVVTGPTGSGKSTTLCAMVNNINMTREDHIITIEDPVEFVHENIKCLVNQREVHNHTMSFKDALRAALREDPDIVLVGEMRDLETISIAIETAETGHLVFGTLHTTTAVSTVDRIIDQFPADRQQQVRVMLSESLKGVVAQTLLPKKGGGRVAALEVLIVTPAISNLIREGKTFQIGSAMQTGKAQGMVMLNDALFDLVQKDIVEPRDAYLKAIDKTGFEAMLTKGGFKI